jgi:hypothetical protein
MKLFISYRRKDSMHAAQRVRMCLQMKFGADAVFIDRQIPAGKDWAAHLGAMLEQSSGVIVLVGDAFLRELHKDRGGAEDETDHLVWEIETALRLKKTIYPVLIGALDMPEAGKLPQPIRGFTGYQAVFAREPAFDAAMTVLIKSIADEHGWTEPAPPPAPAAVHAGPGLSVRGARAPLLTLTAAALLWFTGRVILWLGDPAAARAPPFETAFWVGTHYALATTLWGLGPYLAYRAVFELRARARLPIRSLHGLLSVANLAMALVLGGSFLLLSARRGWALELQGLLPEAPGALHYAAQGVVLLTIVFAAMATALLEPRARRLQGRRRVWAMHAINANGVAVTLCGLWFAASLALSLPPLLQTHTVPMVGYLMLCPGMSILVAVWDYAQSQLGVSGTTWQVRTLFGLAIGAYLICTMAYFAYGPVLLL